MKASEVMACALDSWYIKFKEHTIKSFVVPLPTEFVNYLLADGLCLPLECMVNDNSIRNESDDSGSDWDDTDEAANNTTQVTFPELTAHIDDVIGRLGGSAFPKLNWSSPKDATWISLNNDAKCQTASDVYLLLKSSTFIMHDLTQPFKDCELEEDEILPTVNYKLVLRSYVEINPSTEYRCFVRSKTLVGTCQRDTENFHQHIIDDKTKIASDIADFYASVIRDKFQLDNYVFDVYRNEYNEISLLDFNPFGLTTDSLLFSWDELEGVSLSEAPLFRFVESSLGIQPNAYRIYSLPRDVVDLSTGMDHTKLMDLLKLNSTTNGEQLDSD